MNIQTRIPSPLITSHHITTLSDFPRRDTRLLVSYVLFWLYLIYLTPCRVRVHLISAWLSSTSPTRGQDATADVDADISCRMR
jgi:hypothetical protein